MAGAAVNVEGLRELRRDLTRLNGDAVPKAMILAGVKVSDSVANMIRVALPVRSGKLRGSVRTAKIRSGAAVRVGMKSIPYAGPVEFGGYPHGRRFIRQGRYIFPTARAAAPKVLPVYMREIQAAIDRNGWHT